MQREVKALKDSLDHSDTYPDMAKSIVRSLCVVMEGKEPSLRWTTRTPLQEMINRYLEEKGELRLNAQLLESIITSHSNPIKSASLIKSS